jgi:biopolymer transport protein ExbD
VRKPSEPVYERLVFLNRRYRLHNRRTRGFVDATSLVDVVLILFLFFLIQAPFVVQPGIRLDLPTTAFADGADYGTLVVTITQEGMVFFNDARITLDGLKEAFARAAHERPGFSLLVEADERVPHGSLVRIYTMAREAGIPDVILAGRAESAGVEGP